MKKWKLLTKTTPKNIQDVVDTIAKNRDFLIAENKKNPSDLTAKDVDIDEKHLKKAQKRIETALKNKEQIIVFGDYDADGICAATVLWETLYKKSKKTMPYLPDRKTEGYGLSPAAIDNLLKKYPDTKLIITVDNGIVAHEAVDYAKKKGIDVIITDHHTKGEEYPNAHAVVYTTQLSGAGVAWMLAKSITTENIEKELDLVAVAAVADMVPLTGVNRLLVAKGLKMLNATTRLGLKELISEASIRNKNIGVYDIGFLIAPRLNAAGRVGHAIESLRLLCTKSRDNARVFAGKLGAHNRKRQILTENLTEHAQKKMEQVAKKEKLLFAHHPTYDEGVIGLIASKLVEKYYLPSIAISQGKEISKGSARSIAGVNVIDLIRKGEKYLDGAGGHPMAAGFSIKTKHLPDFQKIIQEEAQKVVTEDLLLRELKIDSVLTSDLINFDLYEMIQDFYPFGIGNPEPTFASKKVTIKKFDLVGKDASHLRLIVSDGKKEFETIGFGLASQFKKKTGDSIDIAYILDVNEWRGRKKISLKLKDFI